MVQLIQRSMPMHNITEINVSSATHTAALADGTDGQIKTIINISTSGTNAITITLTNERSYSSLTLDKEGETITLLFKNSKWQVISGNGATVNGIILIEVNYEYNIKELQDERDVLKGDFKTLSERNQSVENELGQLKSNLNAHLWCNTTS